MEDFIKENSALYERTMTLVSLYGLRVIFAALTLFIGFWVIGRISNFVISNLERKDFDPTIRLYLSRILSIALKVMLIISVAGMVGIQTTSFMAVLGAAGLAVGLALQGSLSNFSGGVLMLVLRPFRVGDYIHAQGEEGFVTTIDIFSTTLLKVDNRRVILPNGPLIGGTIINATAEPTRRVDISVGVAYKDDLVKVRNVLMALAASDPRVLKDPAPMVGVTGFGDSCVNITFRAWCQTADYWNVYFDLYQKTKETFDTHGITIPFPQREVHSVK